ncbi:MAG: hypothetical protein C0605_04360 [Hyphomicrobiales bacterium]|nr:MAG: hypothetical protein C0605_04360 [Hyphomicrobiales bacterium]
MAMTAVALASGSRPADAKANFLGQHEAWAAYSNGSGNKLTCFVVSQPISTLPKNVNRDPVFFMITHWPREKTYHQVSVITGYPYKKGSVATVTVGADKFNLYTMKDGAWVEHHSTEIRMVRAMKAGAKMTVKGTSWRGTVTTDTYSLSGITAALAQLQKECK